MKRAICVLLLGILAVSCSRDWETLAKDFRISFRPDSDQIELSLKADSEKDAQFFEFMAFPRPVIKGILDGERRFFLLDTGKPGWGSLRKWNPPKGWVSRALVVDHPLEDVKVNVLGYYESKLLVLQGTVIKDMNFDVSDWMNFGGNSIFDNLGMDAIGQFEMILNLPKREISLRKIVNS